MNVRTASSAALVALLLAGCGDSGRPAVPATPDPLNAASICGNASESWRSFDVRVRGTRLKAAVLGHGDVGVALANDSGNSVCGWMPLADALARGGRSVAVFEYAHPRRAAAELAAVAAALRAAGSRRVAIVGASLGARAVVQAAARDGARFAAAVSLSAERAISDLPEILPDARRVRVPSLYVGSRHDAYTEQGQDTRDLHRVTPAAVDRLLLVGGRSHGVDLLLERSVRTAVLDFIAANAG